MFVLQNTMLYFRLRIDQLQFAVYNTYNTKRIYRKSSLRVIYSFLTLRCYFPDGCYLDGCQGLFSSVLFLQHIVSNQMTKGECKMKRYLVSPELKPYLRRIMDRRSLDYSFQCADGKDYCNIYMSSNSFHKLIKRAACEKRSKEEGVTFVTEEESSNPIRCAALKRELGVSSTIVYK